MHGESRTVSTQRRRHGVRQEEVMTMINWDCDTWGNQVHYASDGSWVADNHSEDEQQEQ